MTALFGVETQPLPRRVAGRFEGDDIAAVFERAGLSTEAARRLGLAWETLHA